MTEPRPLTPAEAQQLATDLDLPATDPVDDGSGNPGECYWCCGEGWEECDDPMQCTSPHNEWGECPCSSCGGSGLAKDMTIW